MSSLSQATNRRRIIFSKCKNNISVPITPPPRQNMVLPERAPVRNNARLEMSLRNINKKLFRFPKRYAQKLPHINMNYAPPIYFASNPTKGIFTTGPYRIMKYYLNLQTHIVNRSQMDNSVHSFVS